MVQVHVCTSDVHARLSQFAKRELHSLANYLLTSFSDQDVTLFTRHFVKVGPRGSPSTVSSFEGLPVLEGLACPVRCRQHEAALLMCT